MNKLFNKTKDRLAATVDLVMDNLWRRYNDLNIDIPEESDNIAPIEAKGCDVKGTDCEKVAALGSEYFSLVADYCKILPHSYLTCSNRKKGIVIQVKESCPLTEYVRFAQNDDTIFIESNELTTFEELENYMQILAHLEQQRKLFKKGE